MWYLPCLGLCLLAVQDAAVGNGSQFRQLPDLTGVPARIAFGSCGHQDKPQPVLETVVRQRPDVFIYLGDNIYGDTHDMSVLRAKYQLLGAKPEFQRLRQEVAVLATWDDHDYGANDAGKEYPFKEQSKEIFLDFWNEPPASSRRTHPGIYHAHRLQQDRRTLQLILLDTRTFRDPLLSNAGQPPNPAFKNDYRPDADPGKTLLGAEQWAWLEECFREPADLRIVCSSIQFCHEYNGWESWTNLPAQQQKMLDLIRRTRANGVVFISGDVHWGEISARDLPGGYRLYDVTASGLTEEWPNVEPNQHRVGEVVRDNHFGLIDIAWQEPDPTLSLQIIDRSGTVRVRHQVKLSQLEFP